MSYAFRGISDKDIFEGQVKTDRLKLNSFSRVIDSHNNYKLVCTPVMKGNKPVLNHFGSPLKVYEIIKYTCDKSGAIYVREISLPIYGYLKAIEQFEYLRMNRVPTAWQEQYYQDRPHLYEKIEGKWHRKDYEEKVPITVTGKTNQEPVLKPVLNNSSSVVETPKKPTIDEAVIRRKIDKAVKAKSELNLTNEEFLHAMQNMGLRPYAIAKTRAVHPLTGERL